MTEKFTSALIIVTIVVFGIYGVVTDEYNACNCLCATHKDKKVFEQCDIKLCKKPSANCVSVCEKHQSMEHSKGEKVQIGSTGIAACSFDLTDENVCVKTREGEYLETGKYYHKCQVSTCGGTGEQVDCSKISGTGSMGMKMKVDAAM